MESNPKNELIRITCYRGQVSFDPTGKARGRGVYLCPDEECLKKAKKKRALQRSFDAEISEAQADQLLQEIRAYAGEAGNDGR